MKRTLLVAVLGLTAVAVLAGFSWGRPRHRPVDPQRAERFVTWRVNEALDDIAATPTQRNAVMAVKDRLMPEAVKMMGERGSAHRQLAEAWRSEKPDAKALHASVDQRIDELRAFAHKLLDGALEIHAVLTPGQREELAARAADHHMGMGGHHHR